MRFEELNVSESIKKSIRDMGFDETTSIQEKAIPIILEGKDVIGQSQTGTGKTAAFGIPAVEKVNGNSKDTQTIILCPTRELAIQISDELKKITKYLSNVNILPIYGGQPINEQIRALKRGVQIVVGTPGRIMDHMERKTLRMNKINTVILDEADEMLNMGFVEDIEKILDSIQQDKQMVLFSATMPKSILALSKKYLNNPVNVKITSKQLTTSTIDQVYYDVMEKYKFEALTRVLNVYEPKLSLIFCNTKRKVDDICFRLQNEGYACDKIHGDMKQNIRLNVLDKFNRGVVTILVATDVAARGIDINDIEAVFNYDVPENEEYYVHRIGRTGRAGRKGNSFTFVSRGDKYRLNNIMSYTKVKIKKGTLPSSEDVYNKKIKVFMGKVKSILDEGELENYLNIIDEHFDFDYSKNEIIAALIKMHTTFIKDDELQEDIHAENRKNVYRDNMVRCYINAGKNHNIRVGDILGAIAGETNINGSDVGSIDMFDKYSFVEIPQIHSEKVLKAMNQKKIKGKKIVMEVANASDKKKSRSNGKRSRRKMN